MKIRQTIKAIKNYLFSPPEAKAPENKAEFNTDLSVYRNMKSGQLNDWILSHMYLRTPKDFKTVDAAGGAMDSGIALDEVSAKSAYTLNSGNLPQVLFSWYVQQGFIGYQACSVIAQQWLVNKACSVPAEDAIKNGYDLTINDGTEIEPEVIADMRKFDKQFKIHKNLVNFAKFNRVFGIRIALFNVRSDDPDYYLKPFNLDGVTAGSYTGITQVDPYWITPELDQASVADPASPDFYEPTWWRIGGKRYHKSHLIIIRYSEVSDVLKPSYMYGGLPLPQLIYERIYAAERTANEAPQLALAKRTRIVKVDIKEALANQSAFEERLRALNETQSNWGTYAVDKEDEYQQFDTALGDLDAVIMTGFQLVAAIAGMPATKLIETSPKGFNATGEYQMRAYYDLLEGIENDDTELLDRHYACLIRSEIVPKHKVQPFTVEINWKPLQSPSAVEIADINNKDSQTALNYVQTGAIDGEMIQNKLIADPNSGYNGIEIEEEPGEEVSLIPAEPKVILPDDNSEVEK